MHKSIRTGLFLPLFPGLALKLHSGLVEAMATAQASLDMCVRQVDQERLRLAALPRAAAALGMMPTSMTPGPETMSSNFQTRSRTIFPPVSASAPGTPAPEPTSDRLETLLAKKNEVHSLSASSLLSDLHPNPAIGRYVKFRWDREISPVY